MASNEMGDWCMSEDEKKERESGFTDKKVAYSSEVIKS